MSYETHQLDGSILSNGISGNALIKLLFFGLNIPWLIPVFNFTTIEEFTMGRTRKFSSLFSFFTQGYQNMLTKLSFKREKIIDIQKALKSADVNQDNKLDFEEWRANLKS